MERSGVLGRDACEPEKKRTVVLGMGELDHRRPDHLDWWSAEQLADTGADFGDAPSVIEQGDGDRTIVDGASDARTFRRSGRPSPGYESTHVKRLGACHPQA